MDLRIPLRSFEELHVCSVTPMFVPTDYNRYRRALDTLGLREGATLADAKAAYRTLAKAWHPDRFANAPQERAGAEEQMKRINEAYGWLSENPRVFHIDWAAEQQEAHAAGAADAGGYREETVPVRPEKKGWGCGWSLGAFIGIRILVTLFEDGQYALGMVLIVLVFVAVLLARNSGGGAQS